MSFEDSLSESILPQNNDEKNEPEDVSLLLDEVQSLQNEIKDSIKSQDEELSKTKLEKIKGIIMKVNKALSMEKDCLSDIKFTLSQSMSQVGSNITDKEMRERARKLVLNQKRLLNAFKLQKEIATSLKKKKLPEHPTMARGANTKAHQHVASEEKNEGVPDAQNNDDTQLTIWKPEEKLYENDQSQNVEKSNSFIVINRERTEAGQITPQGGTDVNNVPKLLQATNSNVVYNVQDNVKLQQIVKSGTDTKLSTQSGHQNTSSNLLIKYRVEMPVVLKDQATSTKKQYQLKNLQPLLGYLKSSTSTHEATGKQGVKRKRTMMKTIPKQQMSQSMDTICTDTQTVSQLKESQGRTENDKGQGLPCLNLEFKKQEDNTALDLLSLKFIVTMKDEEFVPSDQFLPKDFWKARWKCENSSYGNEFLQMLDAMELDS